MKSLKSLLVLGLLAATALNLTACNDSEIAFGAGLVVGAVVSDGGGHHHYNQPNPPRYGGRHRWSEVNLAALPVDQRVAVKYDLSLEQAQILVAHMLPAQKGDLSGLAALGFDKQDLINIYNGQNPSASTLMTLSQKLGLELSDAHDLIQAIKADAADAQNSAM